MKSSREGDISALLVGDIRFARHLAGRDLLILEMAILETARLVVNRDFIQFWRRPFGRRPRPESETGRPDYANLGPLSSASRLRPPAW
jgi:hypothetical protein